MFNLLTPVRLGREFLERQRRIEAKLDSLIAAFQKGVSAMTTGLDDLEQAIAEETAVEDGVVKLLDQLTGELQAAKGDPVRLQAAIDHVKANRTRLAAAVVANTPAADNTPSSGGPSSGSQPAV